MKIRRGTVDGSIDPAAAVPVAGSDRAAGNGSATEVTRSAEQPDGDEHLPFQNGRWLAISGQRLAGTAEADLDVVPDGAEARVAVRVASPRVLSAVLQALAPFVLLPVSLALWVEGLSSINLARMNDYGLISVLPTTVWVAFALFIASFITCWRRGERAQLLLVVHVLFFIVIFYSIPALISDFPRGSVPYRNAGITDYLTRTGTIDARQDAYFSWPAFFTFLGSVVKIGGLSSALSLAKWATVAADLLYLPPLVMILRSFTRDARLVWGAVLIFYVVDWINQDYLAAQSFGYLFYLTILALALHYLRPRTVADLGSLHVARWVHKTRWTRWASGTFPVCPRPTPAGVPATALGGRSAALVTLLVMVLFTASVASHQLTPYAIFLAVTLLVVTGHCRMRGLPLFMGVVLVTWAIFVARGYIDGHLAKIAEGSGNVSQATAANLTQRLTGSDQHILVVRLRMLLSAWVWLLAVLGAVYRSRTRQGDPGAAVLALAPVPLFLLPYGGEVLLRLYFFSLPFVAFFVAALFVPISAGKGAPEPLSERRDIFRARWDSVIFGLVLSGLLAASVFARYGNERIDLYSRGEIAAVRQLYQTAPLGSYLLAEVDYLPWKYQDYEWNESDPTRRRHKYLSLAVQWRDHPEYSTRQMVEWASHTLRASPSLRRPAGYVILTRSQRVHEEMLGGMSPAALDDFEKLLKRSGKFRLIYSNTDAKIYVRNPGK